MELPARPSTPGNGALKPKALMGCMSAPRLPSSHRAPPTLQVVGKIIYLRQNYHFGPQKIAMYLARYRDVTISNSGVWRILKKFYQFTAIDDCTRLRVLRLYPNCDMRTAIRFYDYTASRLPFKIERVQTDNGS
jgi:hypothetical protein